MAKINKPQVDKELRDHVFDELIFEELPKRELEFTKINDRQYGCILTDLNGNERYIRIGAIVAELREDITARELMALECEEYRLKQEAKAEKAKAKEAKIAKDKAQREAKGE